MLMIRSPLRITLGGGGTDLHSYSSQYRGFCISAAINKYTYVGINHAFNEGIILKYSEIETVKNVDEVRHPIFREALKLINLRTPQVEIVSIGDVPSNGAGLGNSGSFTVALLKALYSYKNIGLPLDKLAEMACDININKLKRAQGKQDEYICSIGGIICLEFLENGEVRYFPLKISHDTFISLEENLMMFYTGINHDTEKILSHQETNTKGKNYDMINNLHEIKNIGYEAKSLLESGEVNAFGELLNEQWANKEKRMPERSSFLAEIHYGLLKNGAIGAKIVGSGNGGFILLLSENKIKVREFMKNRRLEELRFAFDFEGCKRMV